MSGSAPPTIQNHRDLQNQIRTKLGTLLQNVQAAPDLDTQALRASIAQITHQSTEVRDFLSNLDQRLRELREQLAEQRDLLDEWHRTGQASDREIDQIEQSIATKLQALTGLQNLMAELQQLQVIVQEQQRIIQGLNSNGGPGGRGPPPPPPGGRGPPPPGRRGRPPPPPGGSGSGSWGQRPAAGVVQPTRAQIPAPPTNRPGTGIRSPAILQPTIASGGWRIPKMRSRSRARQIKTHHNKKKGRGRKTRRNKKQKK